MFYPEKIERQILHDSTCKKPYNGKPLIKPKIEGSGMHERKIGGGVRVLKPTQALQSSGMSGGKKPPTAWQTIIKNTMKEKGLSMKEAINYIKSNNLY